MSEQSMRTVVLELLKSLDPYPVENPAYPGTPDVNYREGWIELKEIDHWGISETPVLLKHYTPQQRIFLRKRWAAGGHAYLLLKVGSSDWLLFDGAYAHAEVGFAAQGELRKHSLATWKKRPPAGELVKCLTASPRMKSKLK